MQGRRERKSSSCPAEVVRVLDATSAAPSEVPISSILWVRFQCRNVCEVTVLLWTSIGVLPFVVPAMIKASSARKVICGSFGLNRAIKTCPLHFPFSFALLEALLLHQIGENDRFANRPVEASITKALVMTTAF